MCRCGSLGKYVPAKNGFASGVITTVSGQRYRVEWKTNLEDSSWNLVQDNVDGTGDVVTVTHTGGGSTNTRLYQVRLAP